MIVGMGCKGMGWDVKAGGFCAGMDQLREEI